MTFVQGEIHELRRQGLQVQTYALRRAVCASNDPQDQELGASTEYLYADARRIAGEALAFFWRRPARSFRVGAQCLHDLAFGTFAKSTQRLRLPLQWFAALALAQRLGKQHIDHLHVQFAHASATVGMYAATLLEIPFSVTGHANDLTVEAGLLREKLERSQLFRIISASSREHLEKQVGPDLARRARVIRCGIDLESYPLRREVRGEPSGCILALGRLMPKKGFDVAIRAFAEVARQMPELRLTVAGAGPEGPALSQLALRLGIASRVDFLGAVSSEAVPGLLAAARALVLPCREAQDGDVDGIPVVLMEAMARGVPVVSTPVAGIPELIEHGESGLLVRPEDVAGLAGAMLSILTDSALAGRLVKAARRAVERNHDLERTAAKLALAWKPRAPSGPSSLESPSNEKKHAFH